jgi:hypothetical protein
MGLKKISKLDPKPLLPIAYELIGTNWPKYRGTIYNVWIYKKLCNGTTLEERIMHQKEFENLSIEEKAVIQSLFTR